MTSLPGRMRPILLGPHVEFVGHISVLFEFADNYIISLKLDRGGTVCRLTMVAPPKPSLVKTWAVFGATAILLLLVTLMTDHGILGRVTQWEMLIRWFLGLLFGALRVTFAIQLVHCSALSSFWPSLLLSLLVTIAASLAMLDRLTWGAGLYIGLPGIASFGYKAFNGRGDS